MKKKIITKDFMIPISFDNIFWNIQVKQLEEKNREEPIIELSWGWSAGMTDEEIKEEQELDGDSPTHTERIRILLSQAAGLRDKLNDILEKYR